MKLNKQFMPSIKFFLLATVLNVFTPSQALADQPLIGELRQFPYTFCPRSWAEADGRLLPIAQYTALFSIFGTMYGGDGRTTFGLPNIQARTVKGEGQGPGLSRYLQGQTGGTETMVLSAIDIPSHTHSATTTTSINVSTLLADTQVPTDALLADDAGDRIYTQRAPNDTMSAGSITSTTVVEPNTVAGANDFVRRQPYIGMRFCVAIQGIFPSRS
ncbi:tail fiber protein [Alteromonas sp. ASW11-36]|uniref:Tail fiber protein n=1 Tax=Alteromonas arenosi TaxID=3055817 RepID=A0ABT7SXJ4_9ALTE|nr:tail fiber protein [Alteromonas sp. ASW11-36]MDM7860903.1 tail fiber protein [Alteromonas sp. ASW11-36]